MGICICFANSNWSCSMMLYCFHFSKFKRKDFILFVSAATHRKKSRIQPGGCHSSRRGLRTNRRGLFKGGSTHRGSREGPVTPGTSIFKFKAGRRRGMRLRGGSRMQQRGASTEESDDGDEEDDDDSGHGDQDQHPHQCRRRSRTDEEEDEDSEKHEFDPDDEGMDLEEEEEQEGPWDSDPDLQCS